MRSATDPNLNERPRCVEVSGEGYLILIRQIQAAGARIFATDVFDNSKYRVHISWPDAKNLELPLDTAAWPKA